MPVEQTTAKEAAALLLQHGAVYTRVGREPFFFSSGWASPVFIDLKRMISFPAARARLIELSIAKIESDFGISKIDQICGCELAGVPFAAAVADRTNLPLTVALKQSRGFSRLAQFEGVFEPGTRTLLLDDLTTDGQTKAMFRKALERAQADVVGIFVLLDYAVFSSAHEMTSLLTLPDIVAAAKDGGQLEADEIAEIATFAADAAAWSQRHGGIASLSAR